MEVFANGGLLLHSNYQAKDGQVQMNHNSKNGRKNGGFLLKPFDLQSEISTVEIEEESAELLETIH